MSVSLAIAGSSGEEPLALPQEMATLSPGSASLPKDLYIRHTGTSKIEDLEIYIRPYAAGVYLGTETAQDDFDLVIGWGDASYPAVSGGGLYVNANHSGSFPNSDWQVFRTGTGDSSSNAIMIPSEALNIGTGVDGEIPAAGEAHIKLRVDVPAAYSGSSRTNYIDILFPFSSSS